MELRATEHKVLRVDFKPIPKSKNKDEFTLNYYADYPEDNLKEFSIIFELFLSDKDKYSVKIKYETVFEVSEDISEDFINSHFPAINAPAIGFPFLRSFVSFMILNAGYPPLILPSINFVNYQKED